jgi:hypothetical protein
MKIGVTGHRQFEDPTVLAWVESRIRAKLKEYAPIYGLTSLAKGADQIFARVVLELGGKLEAVLPFPKYADFADPAEKAGFDALIGSCDQVITLPFAGSKEQSYLAAGQYVADHCELLIAVWDGMPAGGVGGTADVVAYALGKKIEVHQINPSRISNEID